MRKEREREGREGDGREGGRRKGRGQDSKKGRGKRHEQREHGEERADTGPGATHCEIKYKQLHFWYKPYGARDFWHLIS